MASRPMLLLAVLGALALGCSPTAKQLRTASARTPDPDRWDRAACLRGEYPLELDGRAYATARQHDLVAERRGSAEASATARLIDARAAFDVRCATWREQASVATAASNGRFGP